MTLDTLRDNLATLENQRGELETEQDTLTGEIADAMAKGKSTSALAKRLSELMAMLQAIPLLITRAVANIKNAEKFAAEGDYIDLLNEYSTLAKVAESLAAEEHAAAKAHGKIVAKRAVANQEAGHIFRRGQSMMSQLVKSRLFTQAEASELYEKHHYVTSGERKQLDEIRARKAENILADDLQGEG